jgi:hypothetical protein
MSPRKPSHSIEAAVGRVAAARLEESQEDYDTHRLLELIDALDMPDGSTAGSEQTIGRQTARPGTGRHEIVPLKRPVTGCGKLRRTSMEPSRIARSAHMVLDLFIVVVVEKLVGRRVTIAGALWHAVTGHNRTPVLLLVASIAAT